ncbi:unnamed protein product, partial [Amoebophrya sp. A120]|eukprot:GSA120T00016500001.1
MTTTRISFSRSSNLLPPEVGFSESESEGDFSESEDSFFLCSSANNHNVSAANDCFHTAAQEGCDGQERLSTSDQVLLEELQQGSTGTLRRKGASLSEDLELLAEAALAQKRRKKEQRDFMARKDSYAHLLDDNHPMWQVDMEDIFKNADELLCPPMARLLREEQRAVKHYQGNKTQARLASIVEEETNYGSNKKNTNSCKSGNIKTTTSIQAKSSTAAALSAGVRKAPMSTKKCKAKIPRLSSILPRTALSEEMWE